MLASACGRETSAVRVAPLLGGRALLRRSAGAAHRDAVRLDEGRRLRLAVLLRLHAAARIAFAIERVRVPLLLVGVVLALALPASEHARTGTPPGLSLHWRPSRGPFV